MSEAAFTPAAKFQWIEQLTADGALSALALRIALRLMVAYLNATTGDCWPSQETLAGDLGVSVDGIRKAVGQLSCGGHLQVTVGRGRRVSTRYRPIIRPPSEPEKARQQSGFSEPKTQTAVGLFETAKTQTPVCENPDNRAEKTQTRVGVNPFEDSQEGIPLKIDPSNRAFERWWAAYPKHVAKRAAGKAFDAIVRKREATFDELIAGAERYAESVAAVDPKFIKHPTTWLRAGCWSDEFTHSNLDAMALPVDRDPLDNWRRRVRSFILNEYWQTFEWGPRPGHDGCSAPSAVLAEFTASKILELVSAPDRWPLRAQVKKFLAADYGWPAFDPAQRTRILAEIDALPAGAGGP